MLKQLFLNETVPGLLHTHQGDEVSFGSLELILVTNVSIETPSLYSQEVFFQNCKDHADELGKTICADYFYMHTEYTETNDITLSHATINFYNAR